MEIIAHRGASYDAPENTLASVALGWRQNADAVEIDVQFSRDGQLVVIHDDNTRKTARVAKKVNAQTLAELRALEVGRWKKAKWAGEKIPTLLEVLATIPTGKRLFIEIKCSPACIPRLIEAFRESGKAARQIVVIGFARETMARVKRALPEWQVCWVAEFRRTWRGGWTPTAETLIRHAKASGLDGLDLSGRGPLNAKFVEKVHGAGLKLYVWTVDAPAQARKLRAAGVDGITTNRPGWLRAQL
jgi:glycerophosphoryl diester phosphodiesterase